MRSVSYNTHWNLTFIQNENLTFLYDSNQNYEIPCKKIVMHLITKTICLFVSFITTGGGGGWLSRYPLTTTIYLDNRVSSSTKLLTIMGVRNY